MPKTIMMIVVMIMGDECKGRTVMGYWWEKRGEKGKDTESEEDPSILHTHARTRTHAHAHTPACENNMTKPSKQWKMVGDGNIVKLFKIQGSVCGIIIMISSHIISAC
jgi:hypothetical protein